MWLKSPSENDDDDEVISGVHEEENGRPNTRGGFIRHLAYLTCRQMIMHGYRCYTCVRQPLSLHVTLGPNCSLSVHLLAICPFKFPSRWFIITVKTSFIEDFEAGWRRCIVEVTT